MLNRYGKANKIIALYGSFGLKHGAIASSIGHDCHNICIIYADPDDAFAAVEALRQCGFDEFSIGRVIFCTLPVFERYTPTDMGVVDGPRKKFVKYIE